MGIAAAHMAPVEESATASEQHRKLATSANLLWGGRRRRIEGRATTCWLTIGRSVVNLSSRLSRGLWLIPLACVIAGVALSLCTIAIDRAFDYRLVPQSISGGPDAAIEILGTVAASMVSLAALVLTITMVVVQLAMGQFSPRIVQRILEDKPSQLAIGIFVGTFAHAMLALREVQTGDEGVVPGLAVVVAFVLVIVSIMVLVWYVNHIGRALRVSALIELVGQTTRELLDAAYVDHGAPPRFQRPTICAPLSGVITQIDHDALVQRKQWDGRPHP